MQLNVENKQDLEASNLRQITSILYINLNNIDIITRTRNRRCVKKSNNFKNMSARGRSFRPRGDGSMLSADTEYSSCFKNIR